MSVPENSPRPHRVVVKSAAATLVDGAANTVQVWLEAMASLGALPADVLQFVEDNNLWPEMLSKAGLGEDLIQGTGSVLSESTSDGVFFYTLEYNIGE